MRRPSDPALLPEFRAKRAAQQRAYLEANRDKVNEQRRARRTDSTLVRERTYRQAHPDMVAESKRRDREARPEDYRRWKQQWADRNAEAISAKRAADYAANRGAIQARIDAAHKADPDRYRSQRVATSQRRRARLAAVQQEPIDRDVVYQRDGGLCGICGGGVTRSDQSIDHIVPLSKGGPHTYANLRLAHVNCNKRRGNRAA